MKIVYSLEERKIAIKTYKRLKSYTKTIKLLGYPSRHVLTDWVKNPKQFTKEKPKTNQKPGKQYTWKYKKLVVLDAMKGGRVEDLE